MTEDRYIPTIHAPLSDAQRERLVLLIEECGEVIQAATKTLRWGYEDVHPTTGQRNRDMVVDELCDLLTIILLMERAEDFPSNPAPRMAKMAKLRRFTLHQSNHLLRGWV